MPSVVKSSMILFHRVLCIWFSFELINTLRESMKDIKISTPYGIFAFYFASIQCTRIQYRSKI